MTLLQTIGACLAAGLLSFGAGWLTRGREVVTKTVEVPKVVTKTETQTQVQVVDHVVTKTVTKVVKEKDGAVTTTTTKETTADKTKDQGTTTERDKVVAQPVATSQPANWSLGLDWTPRLSPATEYPTGVEVSRRVLGPAWLTGGFDWHDHNVKLGVRVEF